MNVITTDPLVSPVFASEIIDWAKLDEDDPNIDSILISATAAVINFLKVDLMTRTWVLTHHYWPVSGSYYNPSISPQMSRYNMSIELPYTNLISVESVLVEGEAETDYRTVSGKPYSLVFNSFSTSSDDADALVITYKAGFGDSSADTPEPIRKAIMMTAAYIHAHNGMCDAGDAIGLSGAKPLLVPYAVKAGIVI